MEGEDCLYLGRADVVTTAAERGYCTAIWVDGPEGKHFHVTQTSSSAATKSASERPVEKTVEQTLIGSNVQRSWAKLVLAISAKGPELFLRLAQLCRQLLYG